MFQVWMSFQFVGQCFQILIIQTISLLHVQLQHPIRVDSAWVREISLVIVKVRCQAKHFSRPGRTDHTEVPHMPVCVYKHRVSQENAFPCLFKFRSQR